MGKSSAPPPPAAPNYAAAATAQGAANVDAARQSAVLSNPNIISPYGNQTVTYNQSKKVDQAGYDQAMQNYQNQQGQQDEYGNAINQGAAPDISQFTTAGDMQPTVTQTLTPEAQRTLESQQRVQRSLADLGQQGITTAQNVMGTPFQYRGPEIQTSLGQQMPVNYGPAMGQYGMAGSVAPGAYGQAGGVNTGQYGNLRTGADMSGVARMPVNAGMTGQQAIMNRLQPQLAQQSAATAQQLANQGITPGSEAYNNAMREQQQSQNDLLSQAALQGIGLDMSANQQGYGQAMGQAGLYNQALGQGFGQAVAGQQLGNQAIGQNYGQGVTSQNQANAAMGQNYGQAGASAGLYNQAAAQQFNQNLGAAQFGNTAAQQALAQQLGLYNQPLNQISALMSGSQIQAPQFQSYAGQNIQAAPVFQGVQQQGQAAMDQYGIQANQAAANNQGMMGMLGSVAGAAGMAF